MVIILQQTTDNGKRFVSTVVAEESSFNSNFSLGSQNSISERSAIYKQRIDSLFGRHTRLNPFKPTLEPFCIRIEGSNNNNNNNSNNSSGSSTSGSSSSSSSTSSNSSSSGGNTSHHHHGNVTGETSSRTTTPSSASTQLQDSVATTTASTTTTNPSTHPNPTSSTSSVVSARKNVSPDRQDLNLSSDDEDDDYEKIQENTCSIITDSLNNHHHPNSGNIISKVCLVSSGDSRNQNSDKLQNNSAINRSSSRSGIIIQKKCLSSSSASHVSSVRLNCEDVKSSSNSRSPSNFLHSSNSSSMARDMGNKTVGESHMWRNGTYAESPCNTEERQFGIVRASPGGILKFSVEYLGSIPVDGTATALQDLQAPLRTLYLNFLSGTNVMSGQLAITSEGLRFEAPRVRLVNPFTTIAVWAAIKFVARGEPTPTDCAFMPLISDPEGQDKSRLFGRMNPELSRAYSACVTNSHGHRVFRNPPIFACVMREASFSLDCHAFACKCAEDAIVIAANLYQSLVDKMRTTNKEGESGYGSLTRNSPATQSQSSPNENRSCSSASSSGSPHHERSGSRSGSCSGGGCCSGGGSGGDISGTDQIKRDSRVVFSDSESIAPVRPPRRKKKTFESGASANLKRYNSDDSVLLKMPHRRKSLKGNNYHYQHLQNSKSKKRVQISTPDETTTSSDSVSESIDQVLDRIINPGGMSFNDLKPPYQELILKIALTLTQDQLYQKSKQAMKKHQQFNFRKKSSKTHDEGTSDENSQFLNMLSKSFSKITSSSSKANHGSGLSGTKRSGGKLVANSKFKSKSKSSSKQHSSKVILKKPSKEDDPFMSFCSGCVCDKCSEKCYCSLPSKHNVKVVGLPSATSATAINATTIPGTSATSGPITHIHTCHNDVEETGCCKSDGMRKKSCGYDTDSCAESEKCYCSLQRVKSNGLKIYNINLDTETSDTDTNSYDFEPFHQMTNETGNETASTSSNVKTTSTRSVEILSYHPSNSKRVTYNLAPASHIQTTSALVHFEDKCAPGISSHPHCHGILNGGNNSNAKGSSGSRNHSSNSSSYLRSPQGSSDEMLSASPNSGQRNKVLLITGSSPSTRVMYKDNNNHYHGRGGSSEYGDGKKSRSSDQHRNLMDITEDEDNEDDSMSERRQKSCSSDEGFAPEKILSMKKTAEIAAMFTDLHLDQTTNVLPELDMDNYRETSRHPDELNGSLDLEASLGYLP